MKIARLILVSLAFALTGTAAPKPNIVLIMADDIAYDNNFGV